MAEAGNALLPLLYPDFYAKMLPIERRQAMANMLMQQGSGDPGNAKFGGLRNAGNMLAGALLGRSADRQLGELYSGPQSPGIHDTGQVTNDPQPQPDLQGNVQPQASQLNLYPGVSPDTQGPAPNAPQPRAQALGGALLGQTPQAQGTAPQAPQAAPAAPVNDGGLPVLPGLSKQSSMMLLLTNPGEYLSAVAKNAAPTDFQKIVGQLYHPGSPQYQAAMQAYAQKQTTPDSVLQAQYAANGDNQQARGYAATQFQTPEQRIAAAAYPNDPAGATQAIRAQVDKAGTQDFRAGNPVKLPNGQWIGLPDRDGRQTIFNKDGTAALQIMLPGAIQNAANTAGAIAGATEPQKIISVTLADGRVVPMQAGQATGAVNSPQAQSPAPSGVGPQGASPATQPQASPAQRPQIGQSTAQGEMQRGAGQAAVEDAKLQPVIATARDAIKHALALNQNAPDSTFLDPEMKAEFAKRFGSNPYSSYKQQWDLDVNGVIVDAFKQLKSAGGRFPQALAEEVIKANGVPFDAPKDARSFALQRLDQILSNFGAASQNTVAGMNAPGAATSTQTAPYAGDKGYQDPIKGTLPPLMNSPAEAAKLPRGTVFRTPDGRTRRVP